MSLENRRHPVEGGLPGGDDEGGDVGKVAGGAALVLEPGAKRRAVEVGPQARNDGAADVDAAEGAQRDGQVGGRRAQQRAEDFERVDAEPVAAFQAALGDVEGRQGLGLDGAPRPAACWIFVPAGRVARKAATVAWKSWWSAQRSEATWVNSPDATSSAKRA